MINGVVTSMPANADWDYIANITGVSPELPIQRDSDKNCGCFRAFL